MPPLATFVAIFGYLAMFKCRRLPHCQCAIEWQCSKVKERAGNPDAVTLTEIANRAGEDFSDWLNDRKNSRQMPHRMEEAGYVRAGNDAAKDRLWVFEGKRQVIYAKSELSVRERIVAAQNHVKNQ